MPTRISIIAVMTTLASNIAVAQDMKSMTLASQLGSVLASEGLCDLRYEQSAIAAFVEKSVKADDLAFPSTLKTMTDGQSFQLKNLSESAKTAHCTQIRRVAKSYGFTKE